MSLIDNFYSESFSHSAYHFICELSMCGQKRANVFSWYSPWCILRDGVCVNVWNSETESIVHFLLEQIAINEDLNCIIIPLLSSFTKTIEIKIKLFNERLYLYTSLCLSFHVFPNSQERFLSVLKFLVKYSTPLTLSLRDYMPFDSLMVDCSKDAL